MEDTNTGVGAVLGASTPIAKSIGEDMDFGTALKYLKFSSAKIARKGWNGKGMFIYFVPANEYPAQTQIAKDTFGDMVPYQAYIAMKTVNGSVVPWLASQTDLLAEDWELVA